MKILCTICARGGSKGLRNKNIKKIKGLPLIHHTINQAINSNLFNKIVISSDSEKIINISKKKSRLLD
jgi:CMP-N-acetylneuraminic acid synthetase